MLISLTLLLNELVINVPDSIVIDIVNISKLNRSHFMDMYFIHEIDSLTICVILILHSNFGLLIELLNFFLVWLNLWNLKLEFF